MIVKGNLPHILLVEDDDEHASLMHDAFDEVDHRVQLTRVRSGEDAIGFLNMRGAYEDADRPSIVLLDLDLPGIDGFGVLDAVKSNETLCTIPVVVLTVLGDSHTRHRAYAQRANGYMIKPTEYADLRTMLDDMCTYWMVWNCCDQASREEYLN